MRSSGAVSLVTWRNCFSNQNGNTCRQNPWSVSFFLPFFTNLVDLNFCYLNLSPMLKFLLPISILVQFQFLIHKLIQGTLVLPARRPKAPKAPRICPKCRVRWPHPLCPRCQLFLRCRVPLLPRLSTSKTWPNVWRKSALSAHLPPSTVWTSLDISAFEHILIVIWFLGVSVKKVKAWDCTCY